MLKTTAFSMYISLTTLLLHTFDFEDKGWSCKMCGKNGVILKVSKSRKQILKFSFEPKNERKYFCIFALASKSG